ncbi:MAG TPA: efflux transporter outer membrane subunit [Flavobacterium sp.]|nr:efflux transporter outer membrane subunit [Flavobacterium sp.]
MTNKLINLFLLISVIAISSCKSPTNHYDFHAEFPENYRIIDSLSGQDSMNIADINWKNFFNDPQLNILIERGLENNFDIQTAMKDIEIYRLRYDQSKLEWLPDVNLNVADASYQFRSENFYSSPTANWYGNRGKEAPQNMYISSPQNSSSIEVSWELDIWGKMKRQRRQALLSYLQTEEAQKAILTSLISEIAEGYYNLILLNSQLEVAETNYQLSANTYHLIELQYEAGEITALAKQQTMSQMLSAQSLIPSLKQQISLQENQLSFLLGGFPESFDLSYSKLENYYYNDTLYSGVPLQLLKNRPDVKSAEYKLRSMNEQVGVTQAMQYPSLKINATGGLNSMLAENWFNVPGSLFGGLVGGLTQPIFNKKRLKTNYETALLERDKTEIELQKQVHKAINEVTEALIMVKTTDEQIDIAIEQVNNSSLAVRQANLLFNSGFATYLEVINAQRDALENQLSLNRLRKNKLVARIQLYRALGGGWK